MFKELFEGITIKGSLENLLAAGMATGACFVGISYFAHAYGILFTSAIITVSCLVILRKL